MNTPPEYKIQTMSDLFNLASKNNFIRLTEDVMTALYNYVSIRDGFKPLPKDWYITWIDDGKVETTFKFTHEGKSYTNNPF